MCWAPVLESPGIFRSRKAVFVFPAGYSQNTVEIQNGFDIEAIKISGNEAQWTDFLVKTRSSISQI